MARASGPPGFRRVVQRPLLGLRPVAQLADPIEREHLKRTRPRIERLLGLIVYRYNGARKTELQAVWTATLVNLHPIGTALRTQTP
jgi:hypothetical protein